MSATANSPVDPAAPGGDAAAAKVVCVTPFAWPDWKAFFVIMTIVMGVFLLMAIAIGLTKKEFTIWDLLGVGLMIVGLFASIFVHGLLTNGRVRYTATSVLFVPVVGRPVWVDLREADALRWDEPIRIRSNGRWQKFACSNAAGTTTLSLEATRQQIATLLDHEFDMTDILYPPPVSWRHSVVAFSPVFALVGFLVGVFAWLPKEGQPFAFHDHLLLGAALAVVVIGCPMWMWFDDRRDRKNPFIRNRIRYNRRRPIGFAPLTRSTL